MKNLLQKLFRPILQKMVKEEIKYLYNIEFEHYRPKIAEMQDCVTELDKEIATLFIKTNKTKTQGIVKFISE
jgi:site-specific DNA-adenine methylase